MSRHVMSDQVRNYRETGLTHTGPRNRENYSNPVPALLAQEFFTLRD